MTSEPQDDLSAIFEVIHKATQDKQQANDSLVPRWLSTTESVSLKAIITTISVLVIIAVSSKFFSVNASLIRYSALIVYFFVLLAGVTYMCSVVAGILVDSYRRKKMSGQHGSILNRIQRHIKDDYDVVIKLKSYPKHFLEYVLMQYQTTWNVMDGRTALLIGDFRKLGLLPALAAAAAAASKLVKEDANLMLWIPLAVLSSMYLFTFIAMASRERVSYVTSILSHAISLSKEEPHVSEYNKSRQEDLIPTSNINGAGRPLC